jgi:hypothetical protein
MDMWEWLTECYNDGSITLEELEEIMKDDDAARNLWEDWGVEYMRDEILPFIYHIRKKETRE